MIDVFLSILYTRLTIVQKNVFELSLLYKLLGKLDQLANSRSNYKECQSLNMI